MTDRPNLRRSMRVAKKNMQEHINHTVEDDSFSQGEVSTSSRNASGPQDSQHGGEDSYEGDCAGYENNEPEDSVSQGVVSSSLERGYSSQDSQHNGEENYEENRTSDGNDEPEDSVSQGEVSSSLRSSYGSQESQHSGEESYEENRTSDEDDEPDSSARSEAQIEGDSDPTIFEKFAAYLFQIILNHASPLYRRFTHLLLIYLRLLLLPLAVNFFLLRLPWLIMRDLPTRRRTIGQFLYFAILLYYFQPLYPTFRILKTIHYDTVSGVPPLGPLPPPLNASDLPPRCVSHFCPGIFSWLDYPDPYLTLGLPHPYKFKSRYSVPSPESDPTIEQVRSQHRALTRNWHPDLIRHLNLDPDTAAFVTILLNDAAEEINTVEKKHYFDSKHLHSRAPTHYHSWSTEWKKYVRNSDHMPWIRCPRPPEEGYMIDIGGRLKEENLKWIMETFFNARRKASWLWFWKQMCWDWAEGWIELVRETLVRLRLVEFDNDKWRRIYWSRYSWL